MEATPQAPTHALDPYLGRDSLLALLDRSLRAAASGQGVAVLLPGDPGIGKTRTLELVAQRGSECGLRVVRGGCSEVPGAPPLLPWTQILRALGREDALEIQGDADAGDASANFRLSRAVADAVLDAAQSTPLAVLVDDVHAADLGSARLLSFLAREVASAPVLLVAAYRPSDVPDDHPLRPLLEDIGRRARTLPLDALGGSELAALASGISGAAVAPEVVEMIRELSQGNPLFAIQLVELLLAQGQDLGDPVTVERARVDAPQGVRHVLRARLEATSESTRHVLGLGAVLGRDFDLDLLEHTSEDATGCARAIDAAAHAGIVEPVAEVPGRWRFAHVLFRDVLEEALDPTERRGLHEQVLSALEARRDLDEDRWLAAAAHHALESLSETNAPKARDLARRAGERALLRHAQEDAVSWFEGALRALELETDLDPLERAAERLLVLPRLGTARWRTGHASEARADFGNALELARKLNDARAFAEAAVGFVGRTDAVLGPEEESAALLTEALERLDPAPSRLRVDTLTRLASSLYFSPDDDRRQAISLEAVACAEALGAPESIAYALTGRHYVLQRPGHLDERRPLVERTLRMLHGRPDGTVSTFAHYHAVLDHLEAGDLGVVDRHLAAYSAIASRLREPFSLWQHEALCATRAIAAGDLRAAEERAHRALERGREAESPNAIGMFSGHLFCLRRAQGRLGELEPMLAPLVAEFPDVAGYSYARAEAQLAQGHESEVRAFLTSVRDEFRTLPRDFNWPVLVGIASRLAVALRDPKSADLLYEVIRPAEGLCIVLPFGSGWDGSFDLPLGRLANLLGRGEDAERHLQAAAALHARVGARSHLAESWEALADLHETGPEADRFRTDAAELRGELLGDGRAPARAPSAADPRVATNGFVRREDTWHLRFEGAEATLPDSRGLGYLAALIARPREPIHALDLTERRTGGDGAADSGAQLDARARTEVRARMHALQSEIDDAEAGGATAHTEGLRVELERLEDELAGALGLGGRARRVGDPVDRARKAVYARIRTALKQIETELPALARHLRHSVRTGRTCSYEPEVEVDWTVET